MNLILIHGLPGVGKLTVANALCKLTGYRLFHNHLTVDLVDSVFEFGSTPFIELREFIWLSVFERAASEGLPGLIFTFAFEPTVRGDFVQGMLDAVESHGGHVLFVELRCEQHVLEERLVDPSRRKFSKLTSVARLRGMVQAGALQTPALPRPNSPIDNTRLNPLESAKSICEHFGLGE